MTGRARRPGSGDGNAPRRPRTTTAAPSVRQAQESVTQAAQRGRPAAGSRTSPTTGAATTSGQVPAGRYDSDGNLHGADGKFVRDPNRPPRAHSRDSEYPGDYSQRTKDTMAARHTDEGIAAGGTPVDGQGRRIPHDKLTWRDEQGRVIPFYDANGRRNLTFDHDPPVATHWDRGGNNMSRADRAAWYDNPDNLRPMPGPGPGGNFSQGASSGLRFRQDVGPNYSE